MTTHWNSAHAERRCSKLAVQSMRSRLSCCLEECSYGDRYDIDRAGSDSNEWPHRDQDERRSFAQAVAIEDGRLIASARTKRSWRYRGVQNRSDRSWRPDGHSRDSTIRTCIRSAAASTTTWSCAGTACRRSPTRCACCKEQAQRTPPPQWVRVVGGWTEFQFAERRMPTLDEINRPRPTRRSSCCISTTVRFLTGGLARCRLYQRHARAARRRDPARQARQSDRPAHRQTKRDAFSMPRWPKDRSSRKQDQMNSTRHFMRELNRFGITSVIDAGGGFQNYPDDYESSMNCTNAAS